MIRVKKSLWMLHFMQPGTIMRTRHLPSTVRMAIPEAGVILLPVQQQTQRTSSQLRGVRIRTRMEGIGLICSMDSMNDMTIQRQAVVLERKGEYSDYYAR